MNCKRYSWNKDLGLSDVAHNIDIIVLVETQEHEAKGIPNIDSNIIKYVQYYSRILLGEHEWHIFILGLGKLHMSM